MGHKGGRPVGMRLGGREKYNRLKWSWLGVSELTLNNRDRQQDVVNVAQRGP